jgi:hypothetical protein
MRRTRRVKDHSDESSAVEIKKTARVILAILFAAYGD